MASRFLSSSEDEIRQLLEERLQKHKKNIQSRSTSVSRIFVGKGDCRAKGKKRNCSSFEKVLRRSTKKGWLGLYDGEPQDVEIRTEKIFQDKGRYR